MIKHGSKPAPEEAHLSHRADRSPQGTIALSSLYCALALAMASPASAAPVSPPSAGAIQKQLESPQPLPAPPSQVISPAPASRQRSASNVRISVRTIEVRGNTVLPKASLQAMVKGSEGRSLRLADLQSLAERITQAYHRAGYPLAYAHVPVQTIRDGKVVIEVVEPRYDRVEVTGHSRLKPEVATRTVGVKPGQMVAEPPLVRSLILLSRTPGVRAHAVLLPGKKPRTSTLQLQVSDTPLVSGTLFVDNSGNRAVGTVLAGAEALISDPFGHGSSMSVNAMTTPGGAARLAAGGFTATSPYLWNGLRVGIYGSSTTYHIGGDFKALDESGSAQQVGTDATYPLLLEPGKLLVARMDLVRNWLDQTTGATSTSDKQLITIARANLTGSFAGRHGGVNQGNISLSHGRLKIKSPGSQAIDAAGPRTAGNFNIINLQLSRIQPLAHEFTLFARLSGQIADRNLDSSQKFYLGGPHGVIGYEVGDGGGDDGYLMDLELSHPVRVSPLPGRLTAAVVAQGGSVSINHKDYPGFSGRNTVSEASVGLKVSYDWDLWNVLASYGQRLVSYAHSGAASNEPGHFWLSVSRRF